MQRSPRRSKDRGLSSKRIDLATPGSRLPRTRLAEHTPRLSETLSEQRSGGDCAWCSVDPAARVR